MPSRKTPSVIVTADDLGISIGANNGIVDSYVNGIVTTTSLLANGLSFDHAVNQVLPDALELPVGAHLNIMFGTPLTRGASLPIGRGNTFSTSYLTLLRDLVFRFSKNLASAIREEFRVQIEKIGEAIGRPVDHLNTQSHIHAIPALNDILLRLAEDYGVGGVRCVNERPKLPYLNDGVKWTDSIKVSILNALSWKHDVRSGQQELFGISLSGKVSRGSIEQYVSAKGRPIREICVHPGLIQGPEDIVCYENAWVNEWIRSMNRIDEHAALTSWRKDEFEKGFGVKLVSFEDAHKG